MEQEEKEKETTLIQVTVETWEELNKRKRPGDSFDDVIRRLINEAKRKDNKAEHKGVS